MFRIKEDIKLLTQNQMGVLYMVGSVVCFSIMDICVKWLDYYPVGQVLFLRFFIGFIPTFSDKKKIEATVTNIGPAKVNETTSANGSSLKPKNNAMIANAPQIALKA